MQDAIKRLRDNISAVFFGNAEAVDRIICCLLARGHVLIEDVPGVGKTVLATALARSIRCSFNRVQLTPDLLPGDIIGVSVYNRSTQAFEFKKGPIFANIVLADEINRTPPRTQTALLEAMNERRITVDGTTYELDEPFMILATQNPYEFEGTYVLPENQLDRFLMRIHLGYPSAEQEARVLDTRPAESALPGLPEVMSGEEVIALQRSVDGVRMDDSLIQYIVRLAEATRRSEDVQLGISPRGSLALAHAARATAVLDGRDYVIPEDISVNIVPVCAHRITSRAFVRDGERDDTAELLARLLETVDVPA